MPLESIAQTVAQQHFFKKMAAFSRPGRKIQKK
jgi:hypothetical protein